MLTVIPNILNSKQLGQVHSLLENSLFTSGQLSAGDTAKRVKNNEELNADAPQMEQLNQLVMGAMMQHPLFQAAALPCRVATPYYARYSKGMAYGDHIDDPVMGPPGGQYRSDLSATLFLNEPDQYEGGDLLIRTSFGHQRIKLNAGHAIIYPSSSLHQVTEVISGERLVAATWIQSMIRDPQQRELLFQLYQSRETLRQSQTDTNAASQIDQVYANLIRMWSEL